MIDIVRISKKMNDNVVFDDVSLKLPSKGIISIVGENGSGKTTFFKILTQLTSIDSGQISYGNNYVNKNGISFFPSEQILVDDLSGWDHIHLFRETSLTEQLIELFEAEKFLDKRIRKYSLGMKQMLLIILTCSVDAHIFIFDEIINGLDPVNRDRSLNFLKDLKDNNLILFSSHLLYDVIDISDQILFIKNKSFYNLSADEGIDVNKILSEFKEVHMNAKNAGI
ncbi:ABC-2 type transport system ATP-binding protein [Enterococcus sp. AZ188]|uniref:ATP-binding cassette domain-containing protein n=1 Tax=Enterococcus sp. AZ188 TaxID=2774678 RepID=UPI003D30165D